MDVFTFDNAFISIGSQTRMVEKVPDEADPEKIIEMLEDILRILPQKKEKLCVECKKMWNT